MNTFFEPDDYDLMIAAVLDMLVDGIPHRAVWDLTHIAQSADEFYAGMQAMSALGDIINDHYEREPDDGTYDEQDRRWGTEDDFFDPPDDWFDEGGPFGPTV